MKGEAREMVEKLLDISKGRLIAGEDVMISEFGKWSARNKRARRGRNLQTGEPIVLDARRALTEQYSPVITEAC